MTTVTGLTMFLAVCLVTPLGTSFVPILISDWRYPYRTILRIFFFAELIHILLCVLIYRLTGSAPASRVFLGTIPALAYIIMFLLFTRYRDGRAVFSLVSAVLLSTIGSSLCSAVAPYASPLWLVLWLCFSGITALILWRFCRKPFQTMLGNAEKGWIKLCVLPVSLLTCLLTLSTYPALKDGAVPFYRVGTVFLCGLSVLLYIVLYQFVTAMRTQYSVKQDLVLLNAQMAALEQQTAQAAAAEEKNRIYRHDQRHFLKLLQSGAAAGDMESVLSVLNVMDRKLDELETGGGLHSFTGYSLLDTVLSLGTQRAREQATELTIRMTLPEHREANLTEFSVVVSNALENALSACAQIPDGGRRKIEVLGKNTPEQFFFAVSNTYCGTIRMDPETGNPLPERAGHGYGTRSIAAFAARYNGVLQYSVQKDWFSMKLLF